MDTEPFPSESTAAKSSRSSSVERCNLKEAGTTSWNSCRSSSVTLMSAKLAPSEQMSLAGFDLALRDDLRDRREDAGAMVPRVAHPATTLLLHLQLLVGPGCRPLSANGSYHLQG